MDKSLIDRWTDTTAFRFALFCSGVLVMPVLGLGLLTTVIGGAVLLTAPFNVDLEQAVFALLSIGGALGIVGYLRAHWGARKPSRHNVTATLVCLAGGIAAALAVAAFVLAQAIAGSLMPWGASAWLGLAALFCAANVVWAMAGVGWIQRLPRCYAEKTGRAFDGLPVVLLCVAIALATTAAVTVATL